MALHTRFRSKWFGIALSATIVMNGSWLPNIAEAAGQSASSPTVVVASSAQAVQPQVKLLSESPITAGATLREYVFTTVRNNVQVATNVHMIVVDLQHPYVKLDIMSGVNGNIASQQTVRNMAKETGAVAGINADFFHMGRALPPIGPIIDDGTWLATPLNSQGWYTFGVAKQNKAVIDYYDFQGTVIAPNGMSFPLSGINRAGTYKDGVHSHVDKVFMYTPEWGLDRANDGNTVPSEIYVQDGVIIDMVFSSTLPLERVPEGGVILRANNKAASFFRNNFTVGDPIIIDYDLQPSDPQNNVRGQDLNMLIGGHTLLIQDGKPSAFTANTAGVSGVHSRSGIGISKDGRYVYMLTADRAGSSLGMSLKDMQDFMVMTGMWKGMNLDGGGSTTMVSRPLGNTEAILANVIQDGASERRVANGIGIYTTAPAGDLLGFAIQGPKQVFLKEKTAYSLKAYDTYYNPMTAVEALVQWGVDAKSGSFDQNFFTPNRVGKATIKAQSPNGYDEFEVEVLGRDYLQALHIDATNLSLAPGRSYKLPVTATLIDGRKKTLPSESIQWELIGFKGSIEGDTLTVDELEEGSIGYLVASYDGFSTMATAAYATDIVWANFDTIQPPISFVGYPSAVKGTASIASNLPGRNANDQALQLTYDFTEIEDTINKAAYAAFNNDEGIAVAGAPLKLTLDLLGDASLNWVRAEVIDANGNLQRIDITQNLDWVGFRTIDIDLEPYKLAYPIKLKRVYIVSPAERQEIRLQSSKIAIDNITFKYKYEQSVESKPVIRLDIDKKDMMVGEEKLVLDQAPLIEKGTTLIPVYFIEAALGGTVRWHGDERKVTIIKDGNIVELWIDNPNMIVNGLRVTSPVNPVIRNKRTMVPLRIISSALGWDVTWIGETRTVLLQ